MQKKGNPNMLSVKVKRIIAFALACLCIVLSFSGCANKSKPLLELEGNEISVNLFELYLSRMKGTLCTTTHFGSAAKKPEFWDTIVDAYDKTTYNTVYTDMVLDTAKSYLAALALFEERGLELPDSYIEEIDSELESLVDNVADGSKTTLNSILAEYGANYDVLREAYIIEAKIAYLREDLFGVNGDKVGANLIEEYYQQTYARFKQVFFYTYDYVYETDENGDNIYYTEDGKVSYDTTKTLKKNAKGEQVYDENGDRVYVYTDENGKEILADVELLRLAVPRRVFTLSQIKYVIDRMEWLYENRNLIGGLKFNYEPPVLRFFMGGLEPTSDWPSKLMDKFRKDFGDSL